MDALFENAWQSMRPVPMLRLDFGNGHVVTRTAHGNIATVICTPDGTVVDVIGGLFSPEAFKRRLNEAAELARSLETERPAERLNALRLFHLNKDSRRRVQSTILSESASLEDAGHWKQLADDTQQNDGVRRAQIDALLLEVDLTTPEKLLPRLFKDILHCDLDDPLLGMGTLLYVDEK